MLSGTNAGSRLPMGRTKAPSVTATTVAPKPMATSTAKAAMTTAPSATRVAAGRGNASYRRTAPGCRGR